MLRLVENSNAGEIWSVFKTAGTYWGGGCICPVTAKDRLRSHG